MDRENERGMRLPGRRSIQTKLLAVMGGMIGIVLVINLFIYSQVNVMVKRIDLVFASNVSLGQLKDGLKLVEGSVHDYLSTKSSKALENYYRYAESYEALIQGLNDVNLDNPVKMREKNIREMSVTYLAKADETVQAKRGRNVERYKAAYEELTGLYSYIGNDIYQLSSSRFVLNSANYRFLLNAMTVLEYFSLAIVIVVFGICLGLAAMILHRMIRPLRALSQAARQVAEGDFDVALPEGDFDDEIGVVTATFDQMLSSIRAYIHRLKDSMEKEARMKERELSMEAHLKEAQLKFLQAQINPHFLFNSLNAGAQLAMMEDADATGVFLERMADFFRYNVKKISGDSTLAEEISLVDNYIYILNVRFSGDITYVKRVEARVEGVKVPSMILQPLVENAVNHGIRDMMDRGRICLRVREADRFLRISVTDNGAGMTREQIDGVMEGSFPQKGSVSCDTAGIGVRNVISRLALYYDRRDLLRIDSEGSGRGTTVTLLIPLEEQDHV